jgi:hypothetical protein
MDILAHSLWAGIGVSCLSRRINMTRRTAIATVALAALPDIVQLLPLMPWALGSEGIIAALIDFAIATPGKEPKMPLLVGTLSHHLHCALHSAVLAAALTLLLWLWLRRFWLPLAGWWSHIVIDFFTHSADFYPVPVLYPFTYWGFDGLAWNTPWFLALNYAALTACIVALAWRRRR